MLPMFLYNMVQSDIKANPVYGALSKESVVSSNSLRDFTLGVHMLPIKEDRLILISYRRLLPFDIVQRIHHTVDHSSRHLYTIRKS